MIELEIAHCHGILSKNNVFIKDRIHLIGLAPCLKITSFAREAKQIAKQIRHFFQKYLQKKVSHKLRSGMIFG